MPRCGCGPEGRGRGTRHELAGCDGGRIPAVPVDRAGSRTVVAEPHPDLPCTVFASARGFAGCWVPALFLMAGRRATTCYWQWATSGARQVPLLGAEAIDGVEWVIDMLLPIVRSSIKSPAA